MSMPDTVQSVVQSQRNGPLIAAAAQLWIKDTDRVLDVTYGRGLFWTEYRPSDLTTHDIDIDGVDFRSLPHPNDSFDVIVFDPPYILRGGEPTSSTVAEFNDRYGLNGIHTMAELRDLIGGGLHEAIRVLTPSGRLLVKCTDQISSGKFVANHLFVVSTCIAGGLTQVDEFVHYSGTGPGSWDRQIHSRRAHSFLCILQKGRA